MNYFRKTKSEECMCVTLQFLSMMFRGNDELSLEIFKHNYNLFNYLE
jgi:hypothetical protein